MVFTEERYKILKNKYEEAIERRKTSFMFLDQEVLVSYAKYLLEHLENQLEKK